MARPVFVNAYIGQPIVLIELCFLEGWDELTNA